MEQHGPEASDPERRARHYIVHGRVQGVGFRWHTRREAQGLGLDGWVRNRRDGCVEIWAEGRSPDLDRFEGWLQRGPATARVDRLEVRNLAPNHCDGFEVRH